MIRGPSFFTVGAQKSGTTTLHDWLTSSSEVVMPAIKETHFFRDSEIYSLGEDWYRGQFRSHGGDDSGVMGEIDPEYMFFPECAPRMKAMVKKPKLIFLLREYI